MLMLQYIVVFDGVFSYYLNIKVIEIYLNRKIIICVNGDEVSYDILVLVIGFDVVLLKYMFGYDVKGVFVYRIVEDLEKFIVFLVN